MKVTLRLKGTDEGEANIEFCLFEGGSVTDNLILERVSVGPRSIAYMDFDPSSPLGPVLEVDLDGDGVVDLYLTAKQGNTPLGAGVSITLADGRVVVTFSGVHSAGNTVCQSVESLEGVDPALRAVTPFYWLSTSALFSGSASVMIQYDKDDVPIGRESDLRLYRISGEDAIEDITQQLDQAANTVTGQTDGFSYFVVGYMNASPETSGPVVCGPNPVRDTGAAFFYTLPYGTSTAKLMIFSVSGRLVFETPLDQDSSRFPTAGTWNPVDNAGVPLANGPYVYVLIADGKVIGQGKMVILR